MFDGWTITKDLFDWLCENLAKGKTILELGSGDGTKELLLLWKVISIEEDISWVGYTESRYIYAPIVNGWYDIRMLQSLPDYDLILVDGPKGDDRRGFYDNRHLFNLEVPIVIDDTHRDKKMVQDLAGVLKRDFQEITTDVIQDSINKKFIII